MSLKAWKQTTGWKRKMRTKKLNHNVSTGRRERISCADFIWKE
mgnify:CR=1 FL=1